MAANLDLRFRFLSKIPEPPSANPRPIRVSKIGGRFSVYLGVGTRTDGSPNRLPRYDRAYKKLFTRPEVVEELLRGFLREDWAAGLDFTTLEPVNGSFLGRGFFRRSLCDGLGRRFLASRFLSGRFFGDRLFGRQVGGV